MQSFWVLTPAAGLGLPDWGWEPSLTGLGLEAALLFYFIGSLRQVMLADPPGDLQKLCNSITHYTAMGFISLMYTSKLSSASGHKSSFLGERSKAARPSFFSMAKRRNTRKSNQRLLNPVNVSMNHGRCLHTPSHIILPAIPLGKN